MSILLTGGTGKTSLRIASLLSSSNPPTPYILASRSGTSPPSLSNAQSCTFNWHDQSTWANSWTIAGEHGIKAVYLVAAGLLEPLEVLKPFIEFARRKGTKRFVLLSSSAIEEGGPVMGKVHGYLRGLEGEGVEWCVVRPAWFMENLSEMHHLPTIRDESKLYSATGEGKLGWVSAEDIGAVAYRGLVDEKSHDCDHVVVGNEMLGYGDLADILSDVLGRKITHVKLTEKELAERHMSFGLEKTYAEMLAGLDTMVRDGQQEIQNDAVETVTGRPPKTFRAFVEQNQSVWL